MSEEASLTGLGKVIVVICTLGGVVAALFVEDALGYDGILWGAIFGGAGGGLGGLAGVIVAKLSGQVIEDRGRRRR